MGPRDDDASDFRRTSRYRLLDLVQEVGYSLESTPPGRFLRFPPVRGKAEGCVNDDVLVQKVVEGVQISGITRREPPVE